MCLFEVAENLNLFRRAALFYFPYIVLFIFCMVHLVNTFK